MSSPEDRVQFHLHFYDSGNQILHTHHTKVFTYIKKRIDEMSKQDLRTLLMDISLAAQEEGVEPESGQ